MRRLEFRDVNKGGIRFADPSTRSRWTDDVFGEGNDGSPDTLFAPLGTFKPHLDVQGWESKTLYNKK